MGKLYILGDLHFGARKSSKVFIKYLEDCLYNTIDKLTKEDKVIILGDIFENRNSVDFEILNSAIAIFKLMSEKCQSIDVIVGNHDLYYKYTKQENTNCKFLDIFDNVDVIYDSKVIDWEGLKIYGCSWIDDVTRKNKVIKECKKVKPNIVCGHFDCSNLHGTIHDESTYVSDKDFTKNTLVFSGHYHQNKLHGNIQFVGSFIATTFSDVGSKKGYYVLSNEDKIDIKFVENNCPKFEYLKIDNPVDFVEKMSNVDTKTKNLLRKQIKGNYIRIFLNEYDPNNQMVHNIIKSYEPRDTSISFNRHQVDISESQFTGFSSKDVEFHEVLKHYIKETTKEQQVETDKILGIIDHYHKKYSEEKV